jgi:hypothetical protein
VDAHPHFDRRGRPGFTAQGALRRQRRMQGVARRVEGCTELVADDLKDVAIVRLDRAAQDRMVARQKSCDGLRILLGEPGAAFDIGKQKGDRAVGNGDIASAVDDVLWHKYQLLEI